MAGAIAIVAVLLLVPVVIVMGSAVLAAVLGWALDGTVAEANADSELLELNT